MRRDNYNYSPNSNRVTRAAFELPFRPVARSELTEERRDDLGPDGELYEVIRLGRDGLEHDANAVVAVVEGNERALARGQYFKASGRDFGLHIEGIDSTPIRALWSLHDVAYVLANHSGC